MANIKSAKKRMRQAPGRRLRNRSHRSRMRNAVREVRAAVAAGDKAKADKLLPDTLSLIDATAGKKVMHRNAAARTKSRLSRAVSKLSD